MGFGVRLLRLAKAIRLGSAENTKADQEKSKHTATGTRKAG